MFNDFNISWTATKIKWMEEQLSLWGVALKNTVGGDTKEDEELGRMIEEVESDLVELHNKLERLRLERINNEQ